ncbi:helix-turn-helix domain-containing protein [Vibrio parahaemolyticus]|uniref:helix-turn-helix domain-containing protein n=1 Tax=Vibrio parahaemolyticus TaxID=670 RepID=UPI00067CB453|nr:helix-turn-helix domain-containing protein [Vibrio parahaemolyticus]
MNNTIEATPQTGPIDQHFIAEHIYQLLVSCREDPDLSWLYPLIKTTIAEAALIHTHGNQRKAANVLGIHRFTVSAHYHAYSKWKKGRSQ